MRPSQARHRRPAQPAIQYNRTAGWRRLASRQLGSVVCAAILLVVTSAAPWLHRLNPCGTCSSAQTHAKPELERRELGHASAHPGGGEHCLACLYRLLSRGLTVRAAIRIWAPQPTSRANQGSAQTPAGSAIPSPVLPRAPPLGLGG
jgi:hypothetical protein